MWNLASDTLKRGCRSIYSGSASASAGNSNSRSPCTGSDPLSAAIQYKSMYFNPRSPCGERRDGRGHQRQRADISIHAPHAGSDRHGCRRCCDRSYFNPRSPCGERPSLNRSPSSLVSFQSTLPRRGATIPLPLDSTISKISIHAPRAGSDVLYQYSSPMSTPFQSTLPVRGATF